MTYLFAVIMGFLQGVAEFLPISSSGHLALFQSFFGMENFEDTQLFFTVMLHFGTLISVLIYYWADIYQMIVEFIAGTRDLCTGKKPTNIPPARRMVWLIIVATLPLAVVLPVKGYIEEVTSNVTFVSCMLLLTGCLLYLSDRIASGRKTIKTATVKDAILVGIAQSAGTLPGISRSGITISSGMLCGYDRSFAVRFSFLMSLPAVCGATLLELVDAVQGGLDTAILPYCLVGMMVSAVVGYFAIRLVTMLAQKGKFGAFAYYCWAVGGIALVGSFLI